mmetsp:Transcript_10149/g.35704  ORF Transcript_10149/g.35704 Transcript_10149/m.35704 type:complete len:207 (+) Transcript_10149:1597-2217(+)
MSDVGWRCAAATTLGVDSGPRLQSATPARQACRRVPELEGAALVGLDQTRRPRHCDEDDGDTAEEKGCDDRAILVAARDQGVDDVAGRDRRAGDEEAEEEPWIFDLDDAQGEGHGRKLGNLQPLLSAAPARRGAGAARRAEQARLPAPVVCTLDKVLARDGLAGERRLEHLLKLGTRRVEAAPRPWQRLPRFAGAPFFFCDALHRG